MRHAILMVGLILALFLPGCTTTRMPEEVLVPVPVPCEIEQVPETELPQPTEDDGLFRLAQIALAQIGLLKAENERLRAANTNPCPMENEDG